MRLFVFLTLVALCSCRSKSTPDAGLPPAASREWLEGKLPAETGRPKPGGAITVRVMSDPACLNALDDACRDGWVMRMTRGLVVETLFEVAADGALKPGLAARWSDSEDHRTTTFTLREDATFSDGAKLTSKDVVATFDALMDPKRSTGSLRGEFAGLSSWKVLDEKTVELKWSTPSPFTLRGLSHVPIYASSQLAGEWQELGKKPMGSGPYVIASWERGQSLTLQKREGARAYLDRIVFRFVKDHTAAAALFERGDLEVMTAITPQLWRSLESSTWARRDWNRIKSLDNSYSYIAWNEARADFTDVRVRRALAHLYDAKLISKIVDLDLEVPTTCPYLQGSDLCDPNVKPLPFSPETARALLTEAGFSEGKPLRFSFLLPATQVRLSKLVPLLQEQMKPVGVELEIEKVEASTLSARVSKRDFDAVSRLWTEFDTEQDLFQMFHSSQIDGGANWVGFSNVEVDRLIEQVRTEFDEQKRHALARQLHAKLYSEQPYLFMTSRQSLDAAKKTVHGLVPSVSWYDLRVVWVEH
ncbi:MAG: ABC transporter substrate-binding protein [Archangium sp.]